MFQLRRFDVLADGKQSVTLTMPSDSVLRLQALAGLISRDVKSGAPLRHTVLINYVAQYLLTLTPEEATKIVRTGKEYEDALKLTDDDEEEGESAPVKTTARVWKEPLPKPLDGGSERLKGDGPTRRKMGRTPRRK
jgi:hypothetical protein